MYLEKNIFTWILKKKWKGFNDFDEIVKKFHPLYTTKYLLPFEKTSNEQISLSLRKYTRFFIPNIKIKIKTNTGIKKYKLLDISETGLSFMVRSDIKFFNHFHKHIINITIGEETIFIEARFRHATLIATPKPYHKYGVEITKGKENLKHLLEKNITKTPL